MLGSSHEKFGVRTEPNFTVYWGQKQATTNFEFLSWVLKKLTQGKFAYIWHFQLGINATSLKKSEFTLKVTLSSFRFRRRRLLKTCCPFSSHYHQFSFKGNLPQLFSLWTQLFTKEVGEFENFFARISDSERNLTVYLHTPIHPPHKEKRIFRLEIKQWALK